MTSSIPPHGFRSHINLNSSDLNLSQEQIENLKKIIDQLSELKKEIGYASRNLDSIAQSIENLDPLHSSFLTSVNKDDNRGHVTQIKDKFEPHHHQFLKDLSGIKDSDETTSLRDVSHDHAELSSFLGSLNNGSFDQLGGVVDNYIHNLQTTFHIK